MCSVRGIAPLSYRRVDRSEFAAVDTLEFEPEQVERFLGPLPDILLAVQAGPAHAMIGIHADGVMIGFYVVHPDPRDRSCWWLGWFAIDRRAQGHGIGRAAMTAIMARFRQIAGCRRVRLLVAPDNAQALRLYRQAGFQRMASSRTTGELVLQWSHAGGLPSGRAGPLLSVALPRRRRRSGVQCTGRPATARVHGAFHDPPRTPGHLQPR